AAVDLGDVLVGQQHHDQVGALDGLGDFLDGQAGILGLLPGRTALAQADDDLDAGIIQVLRVRMALRTIADDGDSLALDQGQVAVFVVENFHVGYSDFLILKREVGCNRAPVRQDARGVHNFNTRSPRPTPETPVRTVSRMALRSSAPMKAAILSCTPVSSMV